MTDKYVIKNTVLKILLHVFLLFLVAVILLPVCWLVLNSLKTNQEMFLNSLALPKKWMFVNYATAWGKGLLFYFKNSIVVSAISIICILILSSMLAYGLTRFNLPGQGFMFILVPVSYTHLDVYKRQGCGGRESGAMVCGTGQ